MSRHVAVVLALGMFWPLLSAFDPLASRNREVEQGNAAMQAGKADDALKHYDAAVAKLPADAGAHFDRGTALYALSRFDEAGQEFLRATEAKDGTLKAAAFYNLANAFFKKEKFKEAVEAYKRALALDPRDQRAKWNLEIALRKQKDQEDKQKDQNKDDKSNDDKNKNDDKKNDKDKQSQKDKDQGKNNDDKNKNDDKKNDRRAGGEQQQKQQKQQKQNEDKAATPPEKASAEEIGAVLDSLERSPKDLEKERARIRAVRRAPPARDW